MIDKLDLLANLGTLAILLPFVHFVMQLDGPSFWVTVVLGETLWIGHEWRKSKTKTSSWNPKKKVKEFIENGRIEKDAV